MISNTSIRTSLLPPLIRFSSEKESCFKAEQAVSYTWKSLHPSPMNDMFHPYLEILAREPYEGIGRFLGMASRPFATLCVIAVGLIERDGLLVLIGSA